MIPKCVRRVLLATSCLIACPASEQPLGLISSLDAQQVGVTFDGDPHLLAGTMLAVYGPGAVERHPLTREVIIAHRELVAKIQCLSQEGGKVMARVLWTAGGASLAIGDDVVPLPGEAAPNAPPVLAPGQTGASAPAECAVAVLLPIQDPDGDAVLYSWTLSGTAGRCGRLDALTTGRPGVVWTAPGIAGTTQLLVSAHDAGGHEVQFTTTLTCTAVDDPRKRDLALLARWGADAERPLARLARCEDGSWLGLTGDDGRLMHIDAGWQQWPWVTGSDKTAPVGSGLAVHGAESLLVQGKAVGVLSPDGSMKRTLGGLGRPSDVAVAFDGTVFVADQDAGSVQVFEPDGRFRSRLGRVGDDQDDFGSITRLAVTGDGELEVLDTKRRRIHRFDRLQRRLPGWALTGDATLEPIDICMHPRGLLVLYGNGSIQIYDAKGLSRQAMPSLGDAGLVDDPGVPDALTVDGGGAVLVSYARSGLVARYNDKGAVSGVRGVRLRDRGWWCADAGGHLACLDDDNNLGQLDAEGWLVARRGGINRKHCSGMAYAADGTWIELLDRKAKSVTRLSCAEHAEPPLTFGQEGKNNGQFDDPVALAVDDAGRTYVLDAGLYHVSVFDPKGVFLFNFGSYGKGASELKEPLLLAVSPNGDAAYVYDDYHYEIKKYALDFKTGSASHVTNTGGKGDGPGQLRSLVGIGCDRLGVVYAVDKSREDVQAIDFRGNSPLLLVTHKFGDFGVRSVTSVTVSADGQLWLAGDGTLSGSRWVQR